MMEQKAIPFEFDTPALGVADRNAMIGCIKQALGAIAGAETPEARDQAIAAYKAAYHHAVHSRVRITHIREKCEATFVSCLTARLRAIAHAVVDGDEDRWERLIDWYEDDRQRMIDIGFSPFRVDALANHKVWRGIR